MKKIELFFRFEIKKVMLNKIKQNIYLYKLGCIAYR